MIIRKTDLELLKMRRSGLLVHEILHACAAIVQEGVTTWDLEVIAEKLIDDAGATSAFKGYYVPTAGSKFPCVLCTSVNEQIVHGFPSRKRILKGGDVVTIDTGVHLDGYYADSAITVPVGAVSEEVARLLDVTRTALELGIAQASVGNRLFDISGAIEKHITTHGFAIVREYVGHGIGTRLHEDPQVPNYIDRRNENPRLKAGMVLAIEPMVNIGTAETRVLSDKWTAVTKDGSYSAHFEHTVAITENGPWVLTRP
ncbi:MAG: type I methionyl aminopeptidase [Bryobacterales bacterium]|jgi:methionyl aminopeptidase|nr:type I methionyl aminopeptidase [Bryobacterales bacterium]